MLQDEENFQDQQNAQNQNPPLNEPTIDPYELEQIRQEVELAYEEFQRLLNGRPRLYTNFPR